MIFFKKNSKLVFLIFFFGSLSLKHVQGSRVVHFTVLALFRCPLRLLYMQCFVFYLMAQNDYLNKNQSKGIYVHVLARFGHCQCKMSLDLISFVVANDQEFVLNKITSRLEEAQNLYSLFRSLCKRVQIR